VRLGLLADIHEAIEPLTGAIRELNRRGVERFIVLGDMLDWGENADAVVALLASLPGEGVWGNHDVGLCGEIDPSVRSRYPSAVLEYFARLRPRIELEGCRFQHIDPHLDPEKYEDLWRFPTLEERLAGLDRCPHRRVFVGHQHTWGIFTPQGPIAWEGTGPFRYRAAERYLTVVHAVREGWCALYDSERDELEPVAIG